MSARKDVSTLKVAIVHDWLVGGGAERVVAELHTLFPDAPIYTSYCTDEWRQKFDGKVITGFLQRWPFGKLRKFLSVLRIWWFTHLDFSGYDLVISSSGNGEAKGIRVPKGTTHVCYCHTPTHFYWRHYDLYIKSPGFGVFNPLARLGLKVLVGPLRRWDLKASERPDYYIANSTHIQQDIKRYYNREAVVMYPPIDTERFTVPQPQKRQGFVIASRQVPQKKFDLAIEACNALKLPLIVLGKGPEHSRLVSLGGPTITYIEQVSDQEMPQYFAQAEAFLWPCFDDFGVVAVEALAAGTPVVAFEAGGSLDYVKPGKTGVFFSPQNSKALIETLREFDGKAFDHDKISRFAQEFSRESFDHKMKEFIGKIYS